MNTWFQIFEWGRISNALCTFVKLLLFVIVVEFCWWYFWCECGKPKALGRLTSTSCTMTRWWCLRAINKNYIVLPHPIYTCFCACISLQRFSKFFLRMFLIFSVFPRAFPVEFVQFWGCFVGIWGFFLLKACLMTDWVTNESILRFFNVLRRVRCCIDVFVALYGPRYKHFVELRGVRWISRCCKFLRFSHSCLFRQVQGI